MITRALDLTGVPVSRAERKAFAYAVAGVLPALLGVPALALLTLGGVLSVTRVGIPFLSLVLTATRGLAALERTLVTRLLDEPVARPHPPKDGTRRAAYDPASWRMAAFAVVDVPLSLVLLCFQLAVRVYALAALTYPLWFGAVHEDGHAGLALPDGTPLDTLPRALGVAAAGLALMALTALVGRQLTRLVRILARALLGPGRLTDRIHDLEETRALAVRDAAATLRRIERDLHDGAQARLVAVAMQLTRARSALDPDPARTDPEKARALVDQSLDQARTALAELRDLVRGIHPPVLDNGLAPALASLCSNIESPTTRVRLRTTGLADRARPQEAVETIGYFCAAELLANATRHAQATAIDVSAAVRGDVLELTVEDDGVGGARAAPPPHSPEAFLTAGASLVSGAVAPGHGASGSGLRGLRERVRTIDGTLTLTSPAGGPTRAVVRLPLKGESAACAS